VILTAFVALAVVQRGQSLYEPTDEVGHFRYIEYLRIFRHCLRLVSTRVDPIHHPPLFMLLRRC